MVYPRHRGILQNCKSIIRKSVAECKQNIQDTVKMFENAGFVVH